MSRTYAIMDVPADVYQCIRALMVQANYDHAIHNTARGDEVLDMHGLALRIDPEELEALLQRNIAHEQTITPHDRD